MEYSRSIVMSIAGLDPSGGAGLLADAKTFEQYRCLGFAVASALTVQTEDHFYRVKWLRLPEIIEQAEPLFRKYNVTVLKIGIVENLALLNELLDWLSIQRPDLRIIWDPVLSASTGFKLMEARNQDLLAGILRRLYLITPNLPEALALSNLADEIAAAKMLSRHCKVLLKGGHSTDAPGVDLLFHEEQEQAFQPGRSGLMPKHGSGCILSAAITAGLAQNLSLETAVRQAKLYIENRLNSNLNLLAYHV